MKCGLHRVFLVYILHALFSWSSSSVFYGYFGCIVVCASLVDGAREWLAWVEEQSTFHSGELALAHSPYFFLKEQAHS